MNEKKGHLYWLRRKLPDQEVINKMESLLKDLNLHTVCNSALCPNRGECNKIGRAHVRTPVTHECRKPCSA